MLTSTLGLRSPLASLLTPIPLTLTLLPSDNKPTTNPSPPSSPASTPKQAQDAASAFPSPKTLATISLLTGTLGLAAMSAVQSATGYALLLSLFGRAAAQAYTTEFLRADISPLTPDQLSARAAMARDLRYAGLFLPLFTSLGVALPEEVLKYLPVVWLARRQRRRGEKKREEGGSRVVVLEKAAAVRVAAAAATGFALVELAGYVYAAAAVPAGPSLTVTLLERVFVALPGHFATAVLSASRGADAAAGGGEEESVGGWRAVLRAVAPSVVYHALFDFILFGSSALVGGHVGWVHPEGTRAVVGTLGACFVVQGVLYVYTAREWLGWGRKEKGE